MASRAFSDVGREAADIPETTAAVSRPEREPCDFQRPQVSAAAYPGHRPCSLTLPGVNAVSSSLCSPSRNASLLRVGMLLALLVWAFH